MLLDRLFGIERGGERATIRWSGSVLERDATAKNIFGLSDSTISGQLVNEDTAQNFSAVYAAVRLLCSIPGSLPKIVYKRTSESGDREPDRKHPVWRIMHDRPNPVQTPIQFEETMRSMVLLWGRAVAYIERNGMGEPVAVWPMHTSQIKPTWNNRRRAYDVSRVKDTDLFPKPPFSKDTLLDGEVVDVSTIDGQSIIARAREQIGEGLAAQRFGAGFFGGGAQPYLAMVHPGTVSEQAMERLRAGWKKQHGDETRRVAILQEGVELKSIGMPLDDAQFLESRKFYVTEIARWFGLPPHKLADLERATFSNIEEQQLEFYEGLLPWFARFSQEFHYKLFAESERDDHLIDYVVEGLLKGNIAQRYAAYSTALQWGFMNRNEVRRRENLNSMGEDGDVFLVPVNMQPADKVDEEPEETPVPVPPTVEMSDDEEPEEGDEEIDPKRQAARAAMLAAVSLMLSKEVSDIRNASKEPRKFIPWLEGYYGGHGQKKLRSVLAAAASMSGVDATEPIDEHCRTAKAALLDLSGCKPSEFAERIKTETDTWTRDLPEQLTTLIMGD